MVLLLSVPGPIAAQKIQLAYAGNNLWNPGLRVGTSVPLNHNGLWFWTGDFGGYLDPHSHRGAYLQAGIQKRVGGREKWRHYLTIQPLGLYRSWLSETWLVYSNGQVARVRGAGNWAYAPAAAWHLSRQTKSPQIRCFAGIRGMLLVPYNTHVLPLLMIEAGVDITRRARPRQP